MLVANVSENTVLSMIDDARDFVLLVFLPPCQDEGCLCLEFVDQLATEMGNRVVFVKLNPYFYGEVVQTLNVRGVPTVLLYRSGQEITRFEGCFLKEGELRRAIDETFNLQEGAALLSVA
jgi:thioredoxin-like negative regulator of GroEL